MERRGNQHPIHPGLLQVRQIASLAQAATGDDLDSTRELSNLLTKFSRRYTPPDTDCSQIENDQLSDSSLDNDSRDFQR